MIALAKPVFIIVNGHPATGKTTLAHDLSESLRIPLFCKDDFKERLYEVFGAADRAASRQLGRAAYEMLHHVAETTLKSGSSLIVESNFDARYAGKWVDELERTYSPLTIQVFLHAAPEVIVERYSSRADERRPAHFDDVAVDELRGELITVQQPIDTRGTTFSFDTSDLSSFEKSDPVSKVRSLLDNLGSHDR